MFSAKKQNYCHPTKLVQTKLSFVESNISNLPTPPKVQKKDYADPSFILEPIPKKTKEIKPINDIRRADKEEKSKAETFNFNDRTKKILVTGKPSFCLNTHRNSPQLSAIWDVYGILIKIIKGKIRNENILLMRDKDGSGPILQCIFYDFENNMEQFEIGCFVRSVGRFIGINRLQAFRIQLIEKKIMFNYDFDHMEKLSTMEFAKSAQH